jgi:hypothetical protein
VKAPTSGVLDMDFGAALKMETIVATAAIAFSAQY